METIPLLGRPAFRRVFGEGRASGTYREHDLASILLDTPGLAARTPELLLRCGTEDKYLLADVSSYFHRLVTALGGRSELVLERGGHDWDYWRSAFLPFVSDLARRLDPAEEVP
jgi:S-formylglutathione hydrolase FrmB